MHFVTVCEGLEIITFTYRETEQTFPKSFYIGLTSAEGQKLERFQRIANNIFTSTVKS